MMERHRQASGTVVVARNAFVPGVLGCLLLVMAGDPSAAGSARATRTLDLIFADGFEGGSLCAWSSASPVYDCTGTGPTAQFVATPLSGVAPLQVQFTDQSAPGSSAIVSWSWRFGDGAVSSTQSPSHLYPQPGTYHVALTVTSAAGADTLKRSSYVTVTGDGSACIWSDDLWNGGCLLGP